MKLPFLIVVWIILMGLGELTIQHLDTQAQNDISTSQPFEESQWLSLQPGHSKEDVLNYFQYDAARQKVAQHGGKEKVL